LNHLCLTMILPVLPTGLLVAQPFTGQILAARSIHDQSPKWEAIQRFYGVFCPVITGSRHSSEITEKLC